ncbi:MAG: hypothetical protein Q8O88_02970 [bacterium]|nr:hypothetical protein [bacterium]
MRKINSILFFIVTIVISLNSYSQKLSLPEEEKEEFEYRAGRMVELFTIGIQQIPGFEGEPILKDKAIKNVLDLFAKGSTIELAFLSGRKEVKSMSTYLNNLRNYASQGKLVEIEIVDFNVKNIEPHDTELGVYVVEFNFVQIFRRKNDYIPYPIQNNEELKKNEWDYVDRTYKSGQAVVKKVTNRYGTTWQMLLGDVKADKVEKYE